MPNQLVHDLVTSLPWSMRNSVEGYVDAVRTALPEIQNAAGVTLPETKVDIFLLIITIRRIWAAVNSQYWILDHCVSIADDNSLKGFQAGREEYSKGSRAVEQSRQLRDQLQKLLSDLDIQRFTDLDIEQIIQIVSIEA